MELTWFDVVGFAFAAFVVGIMLGHKLGKMGGER